MQRLRQIASYCLFPLTIWYGVGVQLRNWLYDWGLLRSASTPMPTVGLGNLAAGGTGKTPHAEYLLRLLPEAAFLSRGYRRESQGFHTAAEGGDPCALLGDEPAMVASHFPDRVVAVCEKRSQGLREISVQHPEVRAVVLDDCLQHRQIRPTVMVLLTEYARPYYADSILPFGNLREGRRGRRRADIIVVTKCPPELSREEKERMRRRLKPAEHQRVFFSCFDYQLPQSLPPQVTLLTGIAHPEPLVQRLSTLTQVELHRYPDHHAFSQAEIDALPTDRPLLTTEKDAARLQRLDLSRHTLVTVPIRVRLLDEGFDETVNNLLKK